MKYWMLNFNKPIAVPETSEKLNRSFGHAQTLLIQIELTVQPNNLATLFSRHYPGSISDVTMFSKQVDLHKNRIRNINDNESYNGEGVTS